MNTMVHVVAFCWQNICDQSWYASHIQIVIIYIVAMGSRSDLSLELLLLILATSLVRLLQFSHVKNLKGYSYSQVQHMVGLLSDNE
jgi:hypothetical protein